MIDTHAHLYMCEKPLDTLLENAHKAGVHTIVHVAVDIASGLQCLESVKYSGLVSLVPTMGIHPCESSSHSDRLHELEPLFKQYSEFKAVGEIGLDFYKNYAPKHVQMTVFKTQMELAKTLGLPAIIHARHADAEMLELMPLYADIKKVFHCYSSGLEFAKAMDSNTFFSFTGMITYSQSGKVLEALKWLPLNRIMIETDCPYLTPEAFKGQPNESAFVGEVVKKIAQVKNVSTEEVVEQTTATAKGFFGL